MIKREFNIRTMCGNVNSVLVKHQPAVDTIPAMKDASERFRQILSRMDATLHSHETAVRGKAAHKNVARVLLIESLVQNSSALVAYGQHSGNEELVLKNQVPHYKFREMRDVAVIAAAKGLIDEMTQHLTAAADFGISQSVVDEVKALLTDYERALDGKGAAAAEQRGAKVSMESLLRAAQTILKRELDMFAEKLRKSEPEFYAKYRAARVIKDLGIRHEKDAAPVRGTASAVTTAPQPVAS